MPYTSGFCYAANYQFPLYLSLHNNPTLSTVVSQNSNHFVCSWSNVWAIWPVFGREDAVIWPLSVSVFSGMALPPALLVSLVFLSMWPFNIKGPVFSHRNTTSQEGWGPRPRVESHKTSFVLNSEGHSMSQGQHGFKNVKIDSILHRRSRKGGRYRNERDYGAIFVNNLPQEFNWWIILYYIFYSLIHNNQTWFPYSART